MIIDLKQKLTERLKAIEASEIFKLKTTTDMPTIGTEYQLINTIIEAYRIKRLLQQFKKDKGEAL